MANCHGIGMLTSATSGEALQFLSAVRKRARRSLGTHVDFPKLAENRFVALSRRRVLRSRRTAVSPQLAGLHTVLTLGTQGSLARTDRSLPSGRASPAAGYSSCSDCCDLSEAAAAAACAGSRPRDESRHLAPNSVPRVYQVLPPSLPTVPSCPFSAS